MNLFLLNLFARDAAGALVGATLGAPTWYRPVLVLPVRTKPRTTYLVAVLESPGPFAFLTHERPLEGARAPERFATLTGRRITAVTMPPGDRILEIDADPTDLGASGPVSLAIHLYGSQGGAQLRREGTILESVGARRRAEERRTPGKSLVDVGAIALGALVEMADPEHPVQALVPGVDDVFVAAFSSAGDFDATAAIEFRDAVAAGTSPLCIRARARMGNAVPVPVVECEEVPAGTLGPFASAAEAIEKTGGAILDTARKNIIVSLAQPIRRRLSAQRKLLRNLRADVEKALGHERVRREAEILAAFQSTIPNGASTVELSDIYDPDTKIEITLDPALPVQVQIEKRFKKATKLEKSEAHARRRIGLVETEVSELEASQTRVDESDSFASALAQLEAIRTRFGIAPRTKDTRQRKSPVSTGSSAASPHRRFELGGGWFVLVGRNNKDNDELTFHTSTPNDLWFHAQSVPGSHVILKSSVGGSPAATTLEAAASVAAHFSKSRHSGLVPVIYTQRKYVRKFRGAKPGQVKCEREKMVMVEPKLPAVQSSG